jgi:hypothetical protein
MYAHVANTYFYEQKGNIAFSAQYAHYSYPNMLATHAIIQRAEGESGSRSARRSDKETIAYTHGPMCQAQCVRTNARLTYAYQHIVLQAS